MHDYVQVQGTEYLTLPTAKWSVKMSSTRDVEADLALIWPCSDQGPCSPCPQDLESRIVSTFAESGTLPYSLFQQYGTS